MDIDAKGPDGNAFVIMGVVQNIFEQTGQTERWPEAKDRMMSGDYDNLCDVAEEVTNGSVVVVNRDSEEDEE